MKFDIRRNNRTIAKLNDLATAQKCKSYINKRARMRLLLSLRIMGRLVSDCARY